MSPGTRAGRPAAVATVVDSLLDLLEHRVVIRAVA